MFHLQFEIPCCHPPSKSSLYPFNLRSQHNSSSIIVHKQCYYMHYQEQHSFVLQFQDDRVISSRTFSVITNSSFSSVIFTVSCIFSQLCGQFSIICQKDPQELHVNIVPSALFGVYTLLYCRYASPCQMCLSTPISFIKLSTLPLEKSPLPL